MGSQASEEQMRAFARSDAERILAKPISAWDGMDMAFFSAASPLALDEALSVAIERGSREGVGAIAVAAHLQGGEIRNEEPETAAQYAAVAARISSELGGNQ
jgi:hypothetical protein